MKSGSLGSLLAVLACLASCAGDDGASLPAPDAHMPADAAGAPDVLSDAAVAAADALAAADAEAGPPDTTVACAERGEDMCSGGGCVVLRAIRLDDYCAGARTAAFVTCADGDPDGGSAFTWATNSDDGRSAYFTTTQVPPGWSPTPGNVMPPCAGDAGVD